MKTNWTDDEIAQLIIIYSDSSKEELNKIFLNKKYSEVVRTANNLGLKKNGYRKGNSDFRFLLEETNIAYYWMGFLFADGHFNFKSGNIVLCSNPVDLDHLCIFGNLCGVKPKIYNMLKSGYRTEDKRMVRVSGSQIRIIKDLKNKFDIDQNKTYNPPSIEILTNQLNTEEKFISFLCGFWDGDGSIYKTHSTNKDKKYLRLFGAIELHRSWKDFLQFLLDKLYEFGFLKKRSFVKETKTNCAKILITGCTLYKIKNSFPKEITPLKRKWDKVIKEFAPSSYYDDVKDSIKKLASSGLTVKQISKKLKIKEMIVRGYIFRHNIEYKKKYEK